MVFAGCAFADLERTMQTAAQAEAAREPGKVFVVRWRTPVAQPNSANARELGSSRLGEVDDLSEDLRAGWPGCQVDHLDAVVGNCCWTYGRCRIPAAMNCK